MGLQSAMTTALTGLQASETVIDVVGNNIANSNTVGFKSSEVIFATQFLQTQSIGSAPSTTSGGTNPRQIGLGVKVAQISPSFNQGTVEISSNTLDLAIQGDGFLIVQDSQGGALYTRNGQLGLNSSNEVVTASGNKLLGYGVNSRFQIDDTGVPQPIAIPLGAERVAQETGNAVFSGVLNPTINKASIPGIVSSETLGDSSVEFPDDVAFDTTSGIIRTAPAPGTATAVDTGAPTGLTAGDYRYRVTLLDGNGQESSASTEFTIAGVGVNDRIDITGLDTGIGAPWSSYAVYRTEAGGSDFFRVATPAIAAADPITDVVTDATLLGNQAIDTDAIDNGTYTYYVTYFSNSSGDETRPSAPIGTYLINDDISSVRLDLSSISPPDDSQFQSLRIYRNASGDPTKPLLLKTVNAPGTGGFVDSYIDNTPSSKLLPTELDFEGPRAVSASLLVDVQTRNGNTYENLFEVGTLSFTGEQGGSDLDAKELDITASTSVQDLIDFMTNALGLQDQSNVTDIPLPTGGGVITIADGVLKVTSNFGEENSVDIPLTAFKLLPTGSSVTETVDVIFSETQAADGPGTTTEFLVYDSLGSPLSVRITTVLEDKNSNSTTYRWYASSGDSEPANNQSIVVGNGVMIFDSKGNLINSPNARISVQREQTASESPLEIDLDFSSITSLAETNALGEPTSSFNMTSQDGFPPGVLTDFIITESGLIQGQFSNGTQRTLGQVVMARFANNQGLRQVGDSLFAASVNSGEAQLGEPGENGIGALTAGAVELSNTDIGQDLIEMILAQTQYQAGSRVISAAQELLDELLSLNR